jgi:Ca2+-binding RTX toxin-like protein
MACMATGTTGNDTLNQAGETGPGSIVGLAGDDCIFTGTGLTIVTGDAVNDTLVVQAGNTGTVNAGTDSDSVFGSSGSMSFFLGDGADSLSVSSSLPLTIVGRNDSSDGADSIASNFNSSNIAFGNRRQ